MANESPRCCCSVNVVFTVIFIVPYVSALVRVEMRLHILGLTWQENSIGWLAARSFM